MKSFQALAIGGEFNKIRSRLARGPPRRLRMAAMVSAGSDKSFGFNGMRIRRLREEWARTIAIMADEIYRS
ncbi:MAG: hypothetical protein EBS62_14750 [Betaproteobacteria bacterium]|nr:hypothetical protein [Betaproteobacteria bacterium]